MNIEQRVNAIEDWLDQHTYNKQCELLTGLTWAFLHKYFIRFKKTEFTIMIAYKNNVIELKPKFLNNMRAITQSINIYIDHDCEIIKVTGEDLFPLYYRIKNKQCELMESLSAFNNISWNLIPKSKYDRVVRKFGTM